MKAFLIAAVLLLGLQPAEAAWRWRCRSHFLFVCTSWHKIHIRPHVVHHHFHPRSKVIVKHKTVVVHDDKTEVVHEAAPPLPPLPPKPK